MTADLHALFVHAHPDDETINNGATMAKYVAEGRGVTVVTCTAGEMGEVLVPDLGHLAYDKDGGPGERRKEEIAAAMARLGVTDHRWLGGFGRFHDSGMARHEDGHAVAADVVPDNGFWHADLTEAADELVKEIRELRPQVLVTYNEFGGYGHPRPHPGTPGRDVRRSAGRRPRRTSSHSAPRTTSPRSTGAR
ncbi:PIG-L family deacetylase [Nocardioides sp. B-3]|uniref:PIG-L family deacetylase n=1 Tax=Nocardioides sp. B-3 TaxID=2895565 RepID=UPI0021537194|nr:PIG-L family deacetylase [Nocardioides sp. B-3]UUZ60189.1 PIG-L family deacetylase [Nocardioides sp. B-3]